MTVLVEDPIEEVLQDVRAGRPIVIVDDCTRENEGDLMVAAEKITPESINFMLGSGKGLICLTLTEDNLQRMSVPMQVSENTSPFGTNFTVSIDHVSVAGRGVAASSRVKTILAAVNAQCRAEDFVSPGYVFPLRAVEGGVLKRRGQTEASVDIARIAGLHPAGVICEVMDENGQMLRGEKLQAYCHLHKLKLTSVQALAQYRLMHEPTLRRVVEAEIKNFDALHLRTLLGEKFPLEGVSGVRLFVYADDVDGKEHLVIVKGSPGDGAIVRVHSECLTGDVFESSRCDCGAQLASALESILLAESGVLIYLYQEGRDIGLANKLRAYELQDQGYDTVDANIELGFEVDARNYRAAAQILLDLGVRGVKLLTNNPHKVESLKENGISVLQIVPLIVPQSEHSATYIQTKREKLGHMI